MESRIVLCECIRKTLLKAFYMVGIDPVEKL
jgi:arginyl-tRNA synthetase